MSERLSESRLESMHAYYSGVLRKNKDRADVASIFVEVNLRELCHVLDELKRRRAKKENVNHSELTKWMIGSKVGDVIVIPPRSQGSITTNRASARKALRCEDARWRAETQPDGNIRIERLPDGTPSHFGKPKNPIPGDMARMRVGSKKIFKYPSRFPATFKTLARAVAGAGANWKYETLTKGRVRVTRTK